MALPKSGLMLSLSLSLSPSVTVAWRRVCDPGHVGKLWRDCLESLGLMPWSWDQSKALASKQLRGKEEKLMS